MWTEELLALMFAARKRNADRLNKPAEQSSRPSYRMVSDEQLFSEIGFEPEKVYLAN